ncbi:glycosyltransferase family 39 protein [Candidatus Woesearchaeota archaeon]|nr:glycosyltransferase family 39 protein [Candidatus Woesearchaeota archaeon]
MRQNSLNFFKRSILKYRQFPLWYPNEQAGIPFFAHPIYQVFSLSPLLALIIPTSQGMFNLAQVVNVFLSGLFMYILVINLKVKPKFAFISAVCYMFNPFSINHMSAFTDAMQVYFWTPLIFFFLWKAVTSKRWFKYSVITGISLAVTFLGNGYDFGLFLFFVFLSVFIVYVVSKHFSKRIVKLSLISLTILLVFTGLFSVKLFPLLEYNEVSSKKQIESYSYQDATKTHNLKGKINGFRHLIKTVLMPIGQPRANQHYLRLGIPGFIFLLFALTKWKKKLVMALILIIILNILIAWPTGLWYVFWKVGPVFNKLHSVDRSLFLYAFATSILIGIGGSVFFDKIKKKTKLKNLNPLYVAVLAVILLEAFFVSGYVNGGRINSEVGRSFKECYEQNQLLRNLSMDQSIFRINHIDTRVHAGSDASIISLLDLEMLYGGSGIWVPELYTFLGLAHSYPAKFYGMLNTKYIYGKTPINRSNLEFVYKFNTSEACSTFDSQDRGFDGPYLYYNRLYLPRIYVVENSILVIGEKDAVDQTSYSLMIDDRFDPSNLVIIMVYGKVNDYDLSFLKRFDSIILTKGSIDENSIPSLKEYSDSGGILLPDIMMNRNMVSQEEIDNLLSRFKGNYSEVKGINPSYYSPNKRIVELDGEAGWLILTEKFHLFPGWDPKLKNEKKPIYRANGMNSAVYLENEYGQLVFNYLPRSFMVGLVISLITLLLVILSFIPFKKRFK